MVDTTLRDLNQSLGRQGKDLSAIEKDTAFFPFFYRSMLLFQAKTALSEAKRNETLKENFKEDQEQGEQLVKTNQDIANFLDKSRVIIKKSYFELLRIRTSVVSAEKIDRLRFKMEKGKNFDQLEFEREILGIQNEIPSIGLQSTAAAKMLADIGIPTDRFSSVQPDEDEDGTFMSNASEIINSDAANTAAGLFGLGAVVKSVTNIFKKTEVDVDKSGKGLANIFKKTEVDVDKSGKGLAKTLRKTSGNIFRTFSFIGGPKKVPPTTLGSFRGMSGVAGDLRAFGLDDIGAGVDDSQQRRNKILQAEANKKLRAEGKIKKFLIRYGLKGAKLAASTISIIQAGIGFGDIVRLEKALDAKRKELNTDTLTQAEREEVVRSVAPMLGIFKLFGDDFGTYQSPDEIAGIDAKLIAGLKGNSILLDADDLKKAADDAELARREAETKYNNSFTPGPPNLRMLINNDTSNTSFNQNNINVSDSLSTAMD